MDKLALVFIGIGILLGLALAVYPFNKNPMPRWLAILHGIFVNIGLFLLFIFVITSGHKHKHFESLIFFIITGIIGGYLFRRDLKGKGTPLWLIVIHGVIGLTGFYFLFVHIFGGHEGWGF